MEKNPRNAMIAAKNITQHRTAERFTMNGRRFARNERPPGVNRNANSTPNGAAQCADCCHTETGEPLRGSNSRSLLPGVPLRSTPGYSWGNRSAVLTAGSRLFSGSWLVLLSLIVMVTAHATATVIIVTGAPGDADFAEGFVKQAAAWKDAAEKGGARVIEIGTGIESKDKTDIDALRETLAAERPDGQDALWVVLNGHGTWDGKTVRFNLRGPDVSGEDLASWLKPVKRPAVIINTASSSAPFIAKLTAHGRIVITATRNGSEQNFTRFGGYFSASLVDAAADLDTDGAVSLLEAFLAASRRTAEFYKAEGRLATEHALIEDNGDALGTPADWFKGLRAAKKADKNAATDGAAARYFYLVPPAAEKAWPAELLVQREKLEARLEALREEKAAMKEDDYYARLEPLLLELARLAKDAAAATR